MKIVLKQLYFSLLVLCICCPSNCLDNGLALTPPMGWVSWERFKCHLNCVYDPKDCISERLFMQMADKFVSDGYHAAGYEYVNLDDCWMALARDSDGKLKADPIRFPRGIKFLANYMHDRGLKIGIYQNLGDQTCMGFPGLGEYKDIDARSYAEWEIDMVKIDACFMDAQLIGRDYIKMGSLLKNTNRTMLYSCSWPYYQLLLKMDPNYKRISQHCNIWRNWHDIKIKWENIIDTIDFFGDNQEVLARHTGPGKWSDADMLVIGNPGLTPGQARAQMAVWSMIPAPLLMSNDLRNIEPVFKNILQNKNVIKINQDPLGHPGKRIFRRDHMEVWKRAIWPSYKSEASYALLFFNRILGPAEVKVNLYNIGLRNKMGYVVSQVFVDKYYGVILPNKTFSISVPGIDVVMLSCRVRANKFNRRRFLL